MVGTSRRALRSFLTRLGTHHQAEILQGLVKLSARRQRTIYYWLRALGDQVTFYPSITYGALGLVHVHAFIDDPTEAHFHCPYAADAAWVAGRPGARTLYLHCLVPAGHEQRFLERVRHGAACTTIVTGDGWQDNALDHDGPRSIEQPLPQEVPRAPVLLARAFPLVVPVATELLGRRQSLHDIWETLSARLGGRIWSYLPANTRRWPRNGKAYVRQAVQLLNRYGLVRQYVVRFTPLHETTLEVLFVARALADVETMRAHTPLLEYFPGNEGVVVRAHGSVDFLKSVLRSDGVVAWWIINETQTAPKPRVRIETFFDPRTSTWTCPPQESGYAGSRGCLKRKPPRMPPRTALI